LLEKSQNQQIKNASLSCINSILSLDTKIKELEEKFLLQKSNKNLIEFAFIQLEEVYKLLHEEGLEPNVSVEKKVETDENGEARFVYFCECLSFFAKLQKNYAVSFEPQVKIMEKLCDMICKNKLKMDKEDKAFTLLSKIFTEIFKIYIPKLFSTEPEETDVEQDYQFYSFLNEDSKIGGKPQKALIEQNETKKETQQKVFQDQGANSEKSGKSEKSEKSSKQPTAMSYPEVLIPVSEKYLAFSMENLKTTEL